MQFANYTDYRSTVLTMLDGDDSSGSIKQTTLDVLIALGESRVYAGDNTETGLRASTMVADLTGTALDNKVALPADCLALDAVWFDDGKPLEATSESDLRGRLRYSGGGDARRYAMAGDALVFSPEVDDGAVIGGRYYQKPADIKTGGLHATFNRYPELYLYGALCESAPFLGEDSRLPMWKQLFTEWLMRANRAERQRGFDGSRLSMKAR